MEAIQRAFLKNFMLSRRDVFSKEYKFKEQIKSSAGSVMDNIAEGFDRSSRLEFINFMGIAKGSCGEVRSQLYRAFDQQYISEKNSLKLFLNMSNFLLRFQHL